MNLESRLQPISKGAIDSSYLWDFRLDEFINSHDEGILYLKKKTNKQNKSAKD